MINPKQEAKIKEEFNQFLNIDQDVGFLSGSCQAKYGQVAWEHMMESIYDFFLSRFREIEGETIINSARQLGKTRTTCIKLTGIDIDEIEGEKCECDEHNNMGECWAYHCKCPIHSQPKEEREISSSEIPNNSKEVRSCCEKCINLQSSSECITRSCPCHAPQSQCCGKHSRSSMGAGNIVFDYVCSGCGKPFIPSQEKECTHPYIENNMIPDTCRDCGKVLQDNDNKEPWWDKDFDEKYKISGNTFSIDTVHELNEADANELKSLIRSVEERAREEVLQKIKNIPTHNIKDRGDRHWLLREDVYQALDELK